MKNNSILILILISDISIITELYGLFKFILFINKSFLNKIDKKKIREKVNEETPIKGTRGQC